MNQIFRQNKLLLYKFILVLLIILSAYWITSNNYTFYKEPIGTVVSEETKYIRFEKSSNGKVEKYYKQSLTLKIRNTTLAGRECNITNTYTSSQVENTRYNKGDDLFLNIKNPNSEKLSASISNVKRDKYTVVLVTIFIVLTFLVIGKQGMRTLLSLAINLTIFGIMIRAYVLNQMNENSLFFLGLAFTALTLLILGGIRKKSIGSILATTATVWITMLIYYIISLFSGELPYEMMNYISGPDYLELIFRTGILLGGLGAVMDIAITIHSSVQELVETTPSISNKELYASVQEIGYDIMGTMINVLFFTFVSGCIPMTLLKIENGYSLLNILRYSIIFDTIRFLMGAIGIVLSIPVSSFIAILLIRMKWVKKNVN